MRTTMCIFTILALLLGLFWGMAGSAGAAEIKATDLSKPITAEKGDTIAVELVSNHSTGFSWAIEKAFDGKILSTCKAEYREGGKAPGTPGTEIWKFKALAAGTTTFSLAYKRPWEKNVKPARVQKLTITVK